MVGAFRVGGGTTTTTTTAAAAATASAYVSTTNPGGGGDKAAAAPTTNKMRRAASGAALATAPAAAPSKAQPQQPLQQQPSPLAAWLAAILLSWVGWATGAVRAALALPVRCAAAALLAADAGVDAALALLTGRRTARSDNERLRAALRQLRKQRDALGLELAGERAGGARSAREAALLRRRLEEALLAQQAQQQGAAADWAAVAAASAPAGGGGGGMGGPGAGAGGAAAADADASGRAPPLSSSWPPASSLGGAHGLAPPLASSSSYPRPSAPPSLRPLHAAAALAALCARWWLRRERDPLQRKLVLALLWPGCWLYALLALGAVRARSPVGRALAGALTAGCWVLCGYVARAAVELAVGAGASGGGAFGGAFGGGAGGGGGGGGSFDLTTAGRRLAAGVAASWAPSPPPASAASSLSVEGLMM